jgi:AraC-like DNA-binding protein
MSATPGRERLFLRLDGDASHAPETTVPGSTLSDIEVPAELRAVVAHVTVYEERFADGHETVERVVPDGAARVLVSLADDAVAVHVAGASTKPAVVRMGGHVHGLSVTLRPGGTHALFGIPADELAGQVVPWDRIAPVAHGELTAQLASAPHAANRIAQLLAALRTLHRPHAAATTSVIREATRHLAQSTDARPVRTLAADLSLSERRVQQLFASQLGVTPSAWRRLQRVHTVIRRLRARDTSQWSRLALEAGFYDQAHFINEFRAHVGLTPGQFHARVADSSNP